MKVGQNYFVLKFIYNWLYNYLIIQKYQIKVQKDHIVWCKGEKIKRACVENWLF